MNLELEPADYAFRASVEAFVAAHWRTDPARPLGLLAELDAEPWSPQLRRWFDALVGAGWSVPAWPVTEGGTGWSKTRHWLFSHVLAQAGAPSPLTTATTVLGPMLIAHAHPSARQGWLAGIRAFSERWSLAVAEPRTPAQTDLATRARAHGEQAVLQGEKTWIAGGLQADRVLVLARMDGAPTWFVVPAGAPGVTISPLPVMGSAHALARMTLEDVTVPLTHRLPYHADAANSAGPIRVRAAALRRATDAVRTIAREADDAALMLEVARLEVFLDALEAMEFRLIFGPEDRRSGALRTALAIKSAEAGQAVSALRARSMGYHALPFPDAPRFSNEGLFGDELALPAVRQALFDRAWTLYAEESLRGGTHVEALRDDIARTVLGLDVRVESGHLDPP
jgi:alkylation response protein AidB-like acyl-CoA dehydrogenase